MKILVTGGSRGIGKSIVDRFLSLGHEVYFPTRDEIDLSCDIVLPDTEFDVIINNAGINPIAAFDQVDHDMVMKINYFSPRSIIEQCLPYMISKKFGRIINIGSIWIDLAKQNRSAYSASKNALHSITMSLTAEYANYNILSNTVSPGFIGTDLTFKNNTDEELETIVSGIPIGRLGTPDEISKLVYFLAIDNTFICGQNIVVDGGYLCSVN
tara:strand:+ start:151 stop:786 length:636 start_codon:yes stop_codon:yes gene_type:complete